MTLKTNSLHFGIIDLLPYSTMLNNFKAVSNRLNITILSNYIFVFNSYIPVLLKAGLYVIWKTYKRMLVALNSISIILPDPKIQIWIWISVFICYAE